MWLTVIKYGYVLLIEKVLPFKGENLSFEITLRRDFTTTILQQLLLEISDVGVT